MTRYLVPLNESEESEASNVGEKVISVDIRSCASDLMLLLLIRYCILRSRSDCLLTGEKGVGSMNFIRKESGTAHQLINLEYDSNTCNLVVASSYVVIGIEVESS